MAAPDWADPKGKLTEAPAERWQAWRQELPRLLAEIGPTVPKELAHLPNSAPLEQVLTYLYRDGAVIIDHAVSGAVADAVVREMQPYVDALKPIKKSETYGDFSGQRTLRTGSLPARSRASWEVLASPLILELCGAVLGQQSLRSLDSKPLAHDPAEAAARLAPGYKEHPWQLSGTQFIQVQPGEMVQEMHKDRWAFVGDMAFEQTGLEPSLSTIWALTDFTPTNGATRLLPGSHRWSNAQVNPKEFVKDKQGEVASASAHAVMEKGSVVIYAASAWHSAGQNTSALPRIGLSCTYNLGWLRQEENQYLACPPSVAAKMPRKLQRLLGYQMEGYALGYYGDVKGPEKFWQEPRPVNWASTWTEEDWQREAKL